MPPTALSARKSAALDLSTVERRGQSNPAREAPKRIRPHGLQEAPTFRPTEEDFKDPFEYIRRLAPEGKKYGIVKIIPPESWKPNFAIDTERFHFRTRRQELNSVEGGTRANLNYLDQLAKFHKQQGTNLNRLPSVDKRPLDLYRLKKAVEVRGGFDKVCKHKKWAEIGRDLGYSGKIMSSLSTSLKNSYQRWLNPYEEYLRLAKPGVQMKLEHEYGGPLTPSPAESPLKRSQANSPGGSQDPAAVARTSAHLHATSRGRARDSIHLEEPKVPPADARRPIHPSGFTPVNGPGFTAVNASHGVRRKSDRDRTPTRRFADSPTGSSKDTPEHLSHGSSGTSYRMKRKASQEGHDRNAQPESATEMKDSPENGGRRSKRLKKDAPHTVAGSHMTMLRPTISRVPAESTGKVGEKCEACGKPEDPPTLIICDGCNHGYHGSCLDPPLKSPPDHDWHCPRCLVGTGEYGFEEGGIYSLKQFQEKAHTFKENYFRNKMPFDPVLNCKRPVTEDDVEREFWRLVESLTETVEVEYGADIHSTTHGSGFPTVENCPEDPYSADPWNLNVLPLHSDSLFRHIKSDISGMTVPWLYVGMCFSTFCWHNEDHYAYSANYQHFGATKTWYGIPAEDAEAFEEAMRDAVPELFETQPDLLFQLVTLLPPEQLKRAGVRVYALDQRAGQFVITFPQAYHAGFNHGFNFNEAVNFAPHDWEPFGHAGVERLRLFRRQPCFSHDELLLTAVARDNSIRTAQWLSAAIERLASNELRQRNMFWRRHDGAVELPYSHRCRVKCVDDPDDSECEIGFTIGAETLSDEEAQCCYCKAYVYLSRFVCQPSSKVICLLHAGSYDCCDQTEEERLTGESHAIAYRISDEELRNISEKVRHRASEPQVWEEKLSAATESEARPSLKILRSLVSEGERIAWEFPQLPALKAYVERCNDWVERAMNYIVRKQQNRRKNEKVWRKGNSAKAAEMEERDRELRKFDNVIKLLAEAEQLSFTCPEITQLQARADAIRSFQEDAQAFLRNPATRTTNDIEELVEVGKGFNVDIPEVEQLDRAVQQLRWIDQAREWRGRFLTLQDVSELLQQAAELGLPEHNEDVTHFRQLQRRGELWEAKAKELMSAEAVHYQQLEALSSQASSLPVSRETLAAVDQIMNKQREAHRQVVALYEKSKAVDLHDRPKYKDVRQVMDALADLNSKPAGTPDLEREQKRHEDWMRRGKKLFGKANAPLHILLIHMTYVEQRNAACFNIRDVPRAPAEPSSRGHTPENGDSSSPLDGPGRERDVFCICRLPESGMMIECEVCHEWYHCKCLKIARGKVKEDDKYTCPICDWRVKIPRDAARPKLEDLQDWQAEIQNLPFQPDEEDCLARIINTAQSFRDFVRPYINPMMTTPEEVPTQRFYLRKIEGAEILLAYETNFFRQELHRWAPVASEPPPVLEHSLSTRKPRPTKQQKLMAQLGIDNPDDLPQDLRTKAHVFSRRKSSEPHSRAPPPLQPAPGRSATPSNGMVGSSRPASGNTINPGGLHSLGHVPLAPAPLAPAPPATLTPASVTALPVSATTGPHGGEPTYSPEAGVLSFEQSSPGLPGRAFLSAQGGMASLPVGTAVAAGPGFVNDGRHHHHNHPAELVSALYNGTRFETAGEHAGLLSAVGSPGPGLMRGMGSMGGGMGGIGAMGGGMGGMGAVGAGHQHAADSGGGSSYESILAIMTNDSEDDVDEDEDEDEWGWGGDEDKDGNGDGEDEDEEKNKGEKEKKEKGKKEKEKEKGHEVNGGRGDGEEGAEAADTAALGQSVKQASEKRRASKALAG